MAEDEKQFFESGFRVVRNSLAGGRNLTREQRRYCLHALDQRDSRTQENTAWRNMVAVLCGDGGHYHADHGTKATAKHVEERHYALVRQRDKLLSACEIAAARHQGQKSATGIFLRRVLAEIEKEMKP